MDKNPAFHLQAEKINILSMENESSCRRERSHFQSKHIKSCDRTFYLAS
ncbi:hypothetical protein [Brunnivagina elsteri]|nr:hypothetical protein [Calothrix elsteri]